MLVFATNAAHAAPVAVTPPSQASITLMEPLSLVRIADMNFGRLGVSAAGTATINPNTGALTVTGGVTPLGGTVSPAVLRGAGTRLMLVIIRRPTTVTLTRSGGTQTLLLDQITLDGGAIRLIGNTPFDFAVGGRLNIPAGTVEGTYSGNVDVTIEYF